MVCNRALCLQKRINWQKKAIKWLQIWGNKGKWIYEQRANEKNAIFYRLESETEKLVKLPNTKNIEG